MVISCQKVLQNLERNDVSRQQTDMQNEVKASSSGPYFFLELVSHRLHCTTTFGLPSIAPLPLQKSPILGTHAPPNAQNLLTRDLPRGEITVSEEGDYSSAAHKCGITAATGHPTSKFVPVRGTGALITACFPHACVQDTRFAPPEKFQKTHHWLEIGISNNIVHPSLLY